MRSGKLSNYLSESWITCALGKLTDERIREKEVITELKILRHRQTSCVLNDVVLAYQIGFGIKIGYSYSRPL